MLTSAHIKNFRSCKDVKLDNLGHMVALVGRNGAGKTTILKALEWVATTALASDAFDRLPEIDPGEALAEPSVDIEIHAGDHAYRYCVARTFWEEATQGRPPRVRDQESLSLRSSGDNTWQRLFDRTDDRVTFGDRRPTVELNPSTAAIPALSSLLANSDPLQPHIVAVTEVLQRVRYYPGQLIFHPFDPVDKEPSGPISEIMYDHWAAAHASGQPSTSVLFRVIYAHTNRPSIFAELKQLMGPGGLDLLRDIRVVTIGDVEEARPQPGRRRRYYDVTFSPTRSGAELSLDQLSGGTRHALYLLLGLLYDESSTMLIEQPEDGIHPGLLAKLIDILRVNTDPTQIMLASHSPVVLSSVQPRDLILVDICEGSTAVRTLTASEIQRAEDYMQRDGSLAEYLELLQEE
ncbi:ATP-binding protein [Nannocystis sp.]|uniref:AAA family ATPase n=1 Tax=Nannocystis sp. TaxID=1962667 RepID=UPI0025EE9DE5|nr:ATP-binding protein [Nannocystis sp.]MBK7825621.1 AAA family ATPase [Nannocystis sp.]